MKAYVIFGSPNPAGHTAHAVDSLLSQLGISSWERFSCFDRYVAPCCDCRACGACSGCMIDRYKLRKRPAIYNYA